ncbi:MAG TPA: GNAT family N-acetyltransferase, partial [Brevundimonas diminuta]|nr:GNAT family N-acetyltransferase [Brevundimonas diminuta]
LEQQGLIESQYLPSAETWVACRGGRPVGFISLLDSFIGGLFVAPDQQGHGIGRALVAHALSLKGTLMLEVYTDNDQAMRFYEALGFREQSRRATDDSGLPFENAQMLLAA